MKQNRERFKSLLLQFLSKVEPPSNNSVLGSLREKAFLQLCLDPFFADQYCHIPLCNINLFKECDEKIFFKKHGLVIVGGELFFNDLDSTKVICMDLFKASLNVALFLQESYSKAFKDGFLSLLNSSFSNGIYVYLSEDIEFNLTVSPGQGFKGSFARLYFVLAENINVTINEEVLSSSSFFNFHIEFILSEGSNLCFKRTFKKCFGDMYCLCVSKCFKNASFKIKASGSESKFLWTDYKSFLDGENSSYNISSIHDILDNKGVFITSSVFHNNLETKSNQIFKKALDGVCESVFYGFIKISKNAEKSDAYQINKDLKINKKARAFSMPTLNIKNSNVKASHGSTLKDICPQDIFYIQSRGVDYGMSSKLLKESFLND